MSFITRFVGVIGDRSFVRAEDELLQMPCPEATRAKASQIRKFFEGTEFDIAFAPMAPIFAEPAALILARKKTRKEAEFVDSFYFPAGPTTHVRLAVSTVPAQGEALKSKYELYSAPATKTGLRISDLLDHLGDAPLSDYLNGDCGIPVYRHAHDAWKEILQENALHQTDHVVLAVGPGTLMAAVGIIALGKAHRKKKHAEFIEALRSCKPGSYSFYSIAFDSGGAALETNFLTLADLKSQMVEA